MDLFTLITTVIFVSASGALVPGPLFFANITHGIKSGAKAGLAFSIGHTILEIGLVVFLALSLQEVFNQPLIKTVTSFIGGVSLLIFGSLQLHKALSPKSISSKEKTVKKTTAVLLGFLFTGLNPYFILWWLTVGMTLIVNALEVASIAGVIIMYVSHVWMDYVWLTGTAYLAKKGISLIDGKGFKILMIAFGVILIFFGFYFLASPFISISSLVAFR